MTSTTSTTGLDPRPMLTRSLDQAEALIGDVSPAQAGLPTPCPEFDVAGLVAHFQGVVRRIGVVMSGGNFSVAPSQIDVPAELWSTAWAEGRAETERVIADDTVLGRVVTVPWGEVPGATALDSYTGELAVHAWDLAVAIGKPDRLDAAIAEQVLPAYRTQVPPEVRGGPVPFGPVVPVAADASPYDQLVAWSGRDPQWRP